jgi:hypothetical protein
MENKKNEKQNILVLLHVSFAYQRCLSRPNSNDIKRPTRSNLSNKKERVMYVY